MTHVNIEDLLGEESHVAENSSATPGKLYQSKYLNNTSDTPSPSPKSTKTLEKKPSPDQSNKKSPKTKKIIISQNEFKNNKRKIESIYGKVIKVESFTKRIPARNVIILNEEKLETVQNVSSSSLEEKPKKFDEIIIEEVKIQEPSFTSAEKSPMSNKEESHVSEFIFNGEIYVQMPQRVFNEKIQQERKKLLDEVDYYKTLLKKIQEIIPIKI